MKLTVENLIKLIDGKLLTDNDQQQEIEIKGGYVSDLLSDVMGNAREGDIWITIMKHLNVIAVASLASLSAVVFAKNIMPDKAIIAKANEEEICLISSSLSSFELAGKLYSFLSSNL